MNDGETQSSGDAHAHRSDGSYVTPLGSPNSVCETQHAYPVGQRFRFWVFTQEKLNYIFTIGMLQKCISSFINNIPELETAQVSSDRRKIKQTVL